MIHADPFRLGNQRRNQRDYSIKQRSTGKTSLDRLVEQELEEQYDEVEIALIAYLVDSSDSEMDVSDDDEDLAALALTLDDIATEIEDINQPALCTPDAINTTPITLDSLTDEFIYSRTKFTRNEVTQLMDEMGVPEYFILNAHQPGKAYNFSGEHAFIYTLARMASCNESLWNNQIEWHADLTVLGKAFNACVSWMDLTHSHRLRCLERYAPHFAAHNVKLIQTMQYTNNGEVPQEARDIAMFVDACRFRVSKPKGNAQQRAVYNRKYKHNGVVQCAMMMDGIFADVFGEAVGRENDKGVMAQSQLCTALALLQQHLPPHQRMKAYTDKGYDSNNEVTAAYHGPAPVTAGMHHVNHLMSPQRVFIEHGFGKVKARYPFLNSKHLLKLQLSPVLSYFRVAFLLTNAHTCLRGSSTTLHFGMMPPSLHNYFQ
jgi:hypothetical protein